MLYHESTTVSFNAGLSSLAHNADHLCVLTTINAKRNAAANSCENEETKAPYPGYSSRNFFWEVICLTAAEWTHKSSSRNLIVVVWGWLKALISIGIEPLISIGIEPLISIGVESLIDLIDWNIRAIVVWLLEASSLNIIDSWSGWLILIVEKWFIGYIRIVVVLRGHDMFAKSK